MHSQAQQNSVRINRAYGNKFGFNPQLLLRKLNSGDAAL